MFRSRSARFLKTTYFSKGHDDRDKRTWGLQLSNKRQHIHTDSYERYAEEVFLDDSCLDKEVR